MQSIGLTIEEIAIIYLALPFTTFLSPPLTGKCTKLYKKKKNFAHFSRKKNDHNKTSQ